MKRHRKKKPFDIRQHFQKRCIQRLGMELSQDELLGKLRNGTLVPVRRESGTRTHFLWEKDGSKFVLVYNKSFGLFVTVMPFEWTTWRDVGDADI